MSEDEEYPDEPRQSLKRSLFKKIKGSLTERSKQKAIEKQIFNKVYKQELTKALKAKQQAKINKIIMQAQKAAQNKAEGRTRVIAKKIFGAATGTKAKKVRKNIVKQLFVP